MDDKTAIAAHVYLYKDLRVEVFVFFNDAEQWGYNCRFGASWCIKRNRYTKRLPRPNTSNHLCYSLVEFLLGNYERCSDIKCFVDQEGDTLFIGNRVFHI